MYLQFLYTFELDSVSWEDNVIASCSLLRNLEVSSATSWERSAIYKYNQFYTKFVWLFHQNFLSLLDFDIFNSIFSTVCFWSSPSFFSAWIIDLSTESELSIAKLASDLAALASSSSSWIAFIWSKIQIDCTKLFSY